MRRMGYAGGFVLVSSCYLVLRRLLQLAALRVRSNDFKELEIVVRRHEVAILQRQRKRPALTTIDRLFLAAASRFLSREHWRSFMITPATLLRWHRVDEVFRSDEIEIIRTPFRAPQANGVAERFVRTVRPECLDWLLMLNQLHLERVLEVFVTHYNEHRPHRALSLAPPEPRPPSVASKAREVRVHRRDRLGGVIHEYDLAA
jgi:transposase InsO family protein